MWPPAARALAPGAGGCCRRPRSLRSLVTAAALGPALRGRIEVPALGRTRSASAFSGSLEGLGADPRAVGLKPLTQLLGL